MAAICVKTKFYYGFKVKPHFSFEMVHLLHIEILLDIPELTWDGLFKGTLQWRSAKDAFENKSQSYQTFFFVKRTFLYFAIKLAHFIANALFPCVTNTQA